MSLFGTAGPRPDRGLPDAGRYRAPFLARADDVTIALQGGPLWIAGRDCSDTPAQALLEAYRSQGRRLLQQLAGRFSLAIVDAREGGVILAVDPMGQERMAYVQSGDGIAFGSSAAEVAAWSGRATMLRPQALFDFLLLHMVPAPQTVYEGVAKLRPGTCAIFERGRLTIERNWAPAFVTGRGAPTRELEARLHESLQAAVASCRPDAGTGAFLSGGLDSSTVAGYLGRVTGTAPRTFSIGFGVDAYDELRYAHIVNDHFDTIAAEYAVTPQDVVDSFPKIAAAYDEPFGNSSAVPTYYCAVLAARHGISHLLAGDGGDELFGGNERYARQKVFELYGALPPLLRRRLIEPMARAMHPESRILPLRKFRSYVDQARIPMPERLESWNYMYRTEFAHMFDPEFLAAVDPSAPLRAMAETYAAGTGRNLLQRMLFYDWQYTLSDNDLRKVGTMCELAGVRVSYPMLDPRVIDLSLQVPARQLLKGLELRSFYRKAMQAFLPPQVLAKRKHGFGLPFGLWLKTHAGLQDLIYGLLTDLGRRRIVRSQFLDELRTQHRDGHASYYGYAIWDLAMLEAWLQAHASLMAAPPAA